MADAATLNQRVFAPGEVIGLDRSELKPFENLVALSLQPDISSVARLSDWADRKDLAKRVLPLDMQRSLLGHIALTVLPDPFESREQALSDGRIPVVMVGASDKVVRYGAKDVPLYRPRIVGFSFFAETVDHLDNPNGKTEASLWYFLVPPSRRVRVVHREPIDLSPEELLANSAVKRNIAHPVGRKFSILEGRDYQAQTFDEHFLSLQALGVRLQQQRRELAGLSV